MRPGGDCPKNFHPRRDRDETSSKIQYETETRPRVSVPLVSRPRRDRDSRPSLWSMNTFWCSETQCHKPANPGRFMDKPAMFQGRILKDSSEIVFNALCILKEDIKKLFQFCTTIFQMNNNKINKHISPFCTVF